MTMECLIQTIIKNSTIDPNKIAICYNKEEITYKEIVDKINTFALSLKEKKLRKGSRIILEADNLIYYFCAYIACQALGYVVVPIDKNASDYTINDMTNKTKPSLSFIKNKGETLNDYFNNTSKIKSLTYQKDKDSVLALLKTSGTTGNPAIAMHTPLSQIATIENLINGTNITRQTVIFTNLPFDLTSGCRRVLAALYIGATVIVTNNTITLETLEKYTKKYNITYLALTSTNLGEIIDEASKIGKKDLNSITTIESATGILSFDVVQSFHSQFSDITLYNIYGTTESGCVLINNTSDNYANNCIGKPACHAKIILLVENKNEITTPGTYGYITVSGDMNMKGYYRKKALTQKITKDDYIILSDIAYFDKEGYFYFVSRVGDVLNINGRKIFPSDIEKVAFKFKDIVDCACIGKDTKTFTQTPILYIQCKNKNTFNLDEFKNYLSENLESYSIPKEIFTIKQIPRSATGKILRNSLTVYNKR